MSTLKTLSPELLNDVLQIGRISYHAINLFLCGDALLCRNLTHGVTSMNLSDLRRNSKSVFPSIITMLRKLKEVSIDRMLNNFDNLERLRVLVLKLPPTLETIEFRFTEAQCVFIDHDNPNQLIDMESKFPKLTRLRVVGRAVWKKSHIHSLPKSLTSLCVPILNTTDGFLSDLSLLPPNLQTLYAPSLEGSSIEELSKLPQSITSLQTHISGMSDFDKYSLQHLDLLPSNLKTASLLFVVDNNSKPTKHENIEHMTVRVKCDDWASLLPRSLKSLTIEKSKNNITGADIRLLPTSLTNFDVGRLDMGVMFHEDFRFPLQSLVLNGNLLGKGRDWLKLPRTLKSLACSGYIIFSDLSLIASHFTHLNLLSMKLLLFKDGVEEGSLDLSRLTQLTKLFLVASPFFKEGVRVYCRMSPSFLPPNMRRLSLDGITVTNFESLPTCLKSIKLASCDTITSTQIQSLPTTLEVISIGDLLIESGSVDCFAKFGHLEELMVKITFDTRSSQPPFFQCLPKTIAFLKINCSNLSPEILKHLPKTVKELKIEIFETLSSGDLINLPSELRHVELRCRKYVGQRDVLDSDACRSSIPPNVSRLSIICETPVGEEIIFRYTHSDQPVAF